MNRLLSAGCLGLAMMAALASTAAASGEYNPVRRSPAAAAMQHGRIVVKLRERASILSAATAGGARMGPRAADLLGKRLQVALTDGRVLGARTQVLMSTAMDSRSLAALAAKDANVEWAVVDGRRHALAAPSDPLYPNNLVGATPTSGQWYLRVPDSTVLSGIDIETAWNVTHGSKLAGSRNAIVVADLDTGITSHPDLVNKLLPGYDFVGYDPGDGSDGLPTANDGTLQDADPSDPGDWVTASENQSGEFKGCNDDDTGDAVAVDSSWHGTQTAGILGAQTDNGIGMAGVGYDTMILPVRVLGKCGGFDSDIAAGALWAVGLPVSGVPANTHPARVLNLSLGGADDCARTVYPEILTQVRNAGAITVVAAGNESIAVSTPANCHPVPTDADQTPVVIAVGALRHAGTKVGFSNLGPDVTISAPGGNCINITAGSECLYPILTTLNTGTTDPLSATYSNSFGTPSIGTSFSSPIVAGTVALMLSVQPGLSNAQVISLLKGSATPFPTANSGGLPTCVDPASLPRVDDKPATQDECICTTATCGAGMLDAGLAVQRAAGATGGSAVIAAQGLAAIGGSVTLDGRGSAASSGASITNYAWTVTDGESRVSVTSASSGLAATTLALQPLSAGPVTVELTTTDSLGKVGVASRTFAVAGSTPVAAINGIAGVEVGGTLLLSGENSTPPGNGVISYQWSVVGNSTLVTLANAQTSRVTVTGVATGSTTLQLTVTDGSNQTSTASLPVTVSAPVTFDNDGGDTGGGSSGSSSGGGATNPLWLAGLALAGLLLAPRRRLALRRR